MKQVDKGFVFFYHHLSNRRKFIRTVWLVLLGALLSIYGLVTVQDKGQMLALVLVFALVGIWQLVETYRSCKAEGKSSAPTDGEPNR